MSSTKPKKGEMKMQVEKISEAIEELSSNEDLARVAGEALQLISKRGRKAWEALFEMIASDEDSVEEIESNLGEWIDSRALAREDADPSDED